MNAQNRQIGQRQYVSICPSESFESLSAGLQGALWGLGGVPLEHSADNLVHRASIRPEAAEQRAAGAKRASVQLESA